MWWYQYQLLIIKETDEKYLEQKYAHSVQLASFFFFFFLFFFIHFWCSKWSIMRVIIMLSPSLDEFTAGSTCVLNTNGQLRPT